MVLYLAGVLSSRIIASSPLFLDTQARGSVATFATFFRRALSFPFRGGILKIGR
jgi:hypothetical protein